MTRRAFLRGAAIGGGGLLAAYAVGCEDGGEGTTPAPTATAQPTATPARGASPTAMPTAAASPAWRRVDVSGLLPPPRRDHSLVSDGERLYLFGGRGDQTYADLWAYDVAAGEWSELPPTGPVARFGHNAAFYGASGRMLVFGGQAGADFFDDAWALDPDGEWSQLSPGGAQPAPRYGAASALNPDRGLFVSHGFTDAGRFNDTWGLDPDAPSWTDLSPEGERPLERCLVRAVWDREAQRLLLFGGQSNEAPYLGDTWELSADGWRELTVDGPPPRHFYAMAFDGETRRAVLFGGRTEAGEVNDTWLFDSTADAWSEASPEGEPPSPRSGHDAVWLGASRSLLVFGGEDASGHLNDLWELSLPA